MKDFFISYNHEDRQWAEWIAWQLEKAGFSTIIQAWDFVGNWVLEMNEAMQKTARTIAVLSPNYVKALYIQPEWANAFRLDPIGAKDLLIPVRVRPVDLDGVLAQIVYVDLVNIGEGAAVELLLKRVRGERGKPSSSPAFPSSAAETGRVTSRASAAPKPVYPAFDDLFNVSDISEVSNNCMSSPIVDKEEIRNEKLQEHDNGLIDQYINEANDEDEKTAYTALMFLEHLGIKMKIYNSRKLLLFIKRSIEDDKKVGHLSLYLDLIRRMLHTSTTLDKNYTFIGYVKENYKSKIVEVISSVDSLFKSSKQFASQILDEYEIIPSDDRNELYITGLIKCVKTCTDEQYESNSQYFVTRITRNVSNISRIRSQLISIKKSSDCSDNCRKRCDDLLSYYK